MDYITFFIAKIILLMYTNYMNRIKIEQGFKSEKLIVIPKPILEKVTIHPLIKPLFITDIGYFPEARHHYRERKEGSNQYILLFCVYGKGKIVYDTMDFTLEKNQLTIIEANRNHIYYADECDPWSIYWIHFNGDLSCEYYNYIMKENEPVITVSPLKHSNLVKQFEQIYYLHEKGYSINNMIYINKLLGVFLTSIIHDGKNNYGNNCGDCGFINQCIEYMNKNIDKKITLEGLSNHLFLSKNYLIHVFKESTGYSPIDYFIHLKMQKACQLLDTTNKSIKEISKILGYKDPYYFSRVFKNNISLSPNNYRNIKKG